jgi:hypothetical protein
MKTEVVSANINNHLQYKHKLLKVAREKKELHFMVVLTYKGETHERKSNNEDYQ